MENSNNMDVSRIQENNRRMFSVINNAQKRQNEINTEITKINIKNKIRADKQAALGGVIDMYV